MTTLISSIMAHMTKAGKEVASKNGPSCVLLSLIWEESLFQKPFSRIPLKFHWPELGHWLKEIGLLWLVWPQCFIPWDQVFTTLTDQRIILAWKNGLLCMVNGCFTLAGGKKKFYVAFKDRYTSFANVRDSDGVEILCTLHRFLKTHWNGSWVPFRQFRALNYFDIFGHTVILIFSHQDSMKK